MRGTEVPTYPPPSFHVLEELFLISRGGRKSTHLRLAHGPADSNTNTMAKDQMGLPVPNWMPREGGIAKVGWTMHALENSRVNSPHGVQLSPHSRNHDPP